MLRSLFYGLICSVVFVAVVVFVVGLFATFIKQKLAKNVSAYQRKNLISRIFIILDYIYENVGNERSAKEHITVVVTLHTPSLNHGC